MKTLTSLQILIEDTLKNTRLARNGCLVSNAAAQELKSSKPIEDYS
jgi:hypothetical protein